MRHAYVQKLSISEVAHQLHVSTDTVRRLIGRAELDHELIGGAIRVPETSVRAYLINRGRLGKS